MQISDLCDVTALMSRLWSQLKQSSAEFPTKKNREWRSAAIELQLQLQQQLVRHESEGVKTNTGRKQSTV